jgi:methionyl aminopeptidase
MTQPGELYKNLGIKIDKCMAGTNFSVVRTYCGHGIGKLFHTAPNVPHYRKNRAKYSMKPGHTFTIEPMINGSKNWQDKTWPDNWTAVTRDGSWSAQFENTMVVTTTGVEILTAKPEWGGVRDHMPDWNRDWYQR